MNGDDMGPGAGFEPELERLAGEPLDAEDAAVLAGVAALYEQVDPVPEGLVERIKFSLALDEMFDEVARITRVPLDAMAVRGEPAAEVRTETLTFSAERLTVMVSVSRTGRSGIRIDGWVAPATRTRVQLRLREGTREAVTDESGRFVLESLPDGFAQMTFRSLEEGHAQEAVVTPVFEL